MESSVLQYFLFEIINLCFKSYIWTRSSGFQYFFLRWVYYSQLLKFVWKSIWYCNKNLFCTACVRPYFYCQDIPHAGVCTSIADLGRGVCNLRCTHILRLKPCKILVMAASLWPTGNGDWHSFLAEPIETWTRHPS